MRIYDVSRLYNKPANIWERILKEIEQGQEVMPKQYSPLRSAIIAEVQTRRTGANILELGLAAMSDVRGQQTICDKSCAAFKTFCERILPDISSLNESYLPPIPGNNLVPFATHVLRGKFHLSVVTKTGQVAYLYLHPSDWDEDTVSAFIELLAIVGEIRHCCKRDDIWFVDLTQGIVRQPAKSYVRMRQRLTSTMNTLELLMKAQGN